MIGRVESIEFLPPPVANLRNFADLKHTGCCVTGVGCDSVQVAAGGAVSRSDARGVLPGKGALSGLLWA